MSTHAPVAPPPRDFWALTRAILGYAGQGTARMDFLHRVGRMVIDFVGCDAVELRFWGTQPGYRYLLTADEHTEFEPLPGAEPGNDDAACRFSGMPDLERVCRWVRTRQHPPGPCFTPDSGFWTGDCTQSLPLDDGTVLGPLCPAGRYRSLAILPLAAEGPTCGLLVLKSADRDRFTRSDLVSYHAVAQTAGIAVSDHRAQWALRERVKELTCMYGISQLVEQPGLGPEELLQGIVELLPPALQYPERASARLELDGREYRTANWQPAQHALSVDITTAGRVRGAVTVGYSAVGRDLELELFLPEEQVLLASVAGQIALTIERQRSDQERRRLEEQLRHADRLATIGQLAAGVAHELNEPLGSILGFAQLAGRAGKLPEQARRDIDRIVAAALHAREVIHKLMLFARQTPPRTTEVDLNELIRDGLYFLEARCTRNGIELVRRPDPDLPEVTADRAQMLQVLVNLVVNAIQAMPKGGRLTIATGHDRDSVSFAVEDTGVGMDPATVEKVFLPFFTTKEQGEGTGLGLPVVHGIVTAHGGTISVESKVGIGSRFTVRLPQGAGAPDGAERTTPI